nr:transposase [Aestuariicella hydrocarbonica]
MHQLIDNHIDLSAFYDKYNNDTGGRSAYDPAILLKIILFAYYKGITSSREIQWQCEHNVDSACPLQFDGGRFRKFDVDVPQLPRRQSVGYAQARYQLVGWRCVFL